MKLLKLLEGIEYELLLGDIDIDIKDISYDSRKIESEYAFIALRGIDVDGHNYINKAIELGAVCIIVDKEVAINENITVIKLNDTRKELAKLSANLFQNPARELTKIAITGTKGKTTTSFMIKSILEQNGDKVGVIGTIGTIIDGVLYEHKNTTPESYLVQKYMRMMVEKGCKYLIMEVSSQALKVGRVSNIVYDYAIFTNLSMDHVGAREHPTFDDYIYSKSLLFKQSKVGILNCDDKYYHNMIKDSNATIYNYGKNANNLIINDIKYINNDDALGIELYTDGEIKNKFIINAPGKFSAYNASSAIMLAHLLKINNEVIKTALINFNVPGRCEIIKFNNNIKVVIDYAHNNISMESIINTMKAYKSGRVISVFGCGGGRSREIRYELGVMSGKFSDFSIITTDNPRNDNLDEINADIERGIISQNGKYIIIKDREEAIKYAINNAQNGDIIILMGKGHEKFQEINGIIYELDERKIVENLIK